MRQQQEKDKLNPGYYGKFARCRDLTFEQIEQNLAEGKSFVLRLKSPGDPEKRISVDDIVKGHLELPENTVDHVLLKSDGIPTYHFAHAVDDHLMHVTHVVRGDEWLATLPLHVQLFSLLGFEQPKYIHISPLMKMDGDSKRKLSKRKDPEVALSFYDELGYPVKAVSEYVMTLLNSNYEDWRRENPEKPYTEFKFDPAKLSSSGSLFDIDKLNDVSRDVIARMTAAEVAGLAEQWAQKYDQKLYKLLSADRGYAEKIFAIGRGGEKPRKDITMLSGVGAYIDFFFDELFTPDYTLPERVSAEDAKKICARYKEIWCEGDTQPEWFDRIKALAGALGYAPETKLWRKNPGDYKGSVADIAMVLRIAVSGRQQSPDLYEVMNILGAQQIKKRLDLMAGALI